MSYALVYTSEEGDVRLYPLDSKTEAEAQEEGAWVATTLAATDPHLRVFQGRRASSVVPLADDAVARAQRRHQEMLQAAEEARNAREKQELERRLDRAEQLKREREELARLRAEVEKKEAEVK